MLIIEVQMAVELSRAGVGCVTPSGSRSGVIDHPAICSTQSQGSESNPGDVLESHTPLVSGVGKFY